MTSPTTASTWTQVAAPAAHPALEPALRLCAEEFPQRAARLHAALATLLAWTQASAWPEVLWEFSALTGDGFPFEFAFSSADDDLRYTTEIAGPEVNAQTRLATAEQRLAQLGATPLPADWRAGCSHLQAQGSLQYGAWISGRHDDQRDRFKLYVEVPAGQSNTAIGGQQWLPIPSALPPRRTQLQMIGYEAATERTEFYFRAEHLTRWEVQRMLAATGLAQRQPEFWDLLAAAYGQPLRDGLPGASAGFSFACNRNHDVTAFTLFHYAQDVFGSDLYCRARLLALAQARGWQLGLYRAISAPLHQQASGHHTIVGFTVTPHDGVALQIGLRPPMWGFTSRPL